MEILWTAFVDRLGALMAKKTHRLTPITIANKKKPGLHADGAGLYLKIRPTGGKSWVFRYMLDGKARYAGLGPISSITLAAARAEAARLADQVDNEIDPIEARKADHKKQNVADARRTTFKQCAESYLSDHEKSWRNTVHRKQWRNTLKTYVYPTIGNLAVGDVTTEHILKILRPIWTEKPETANRIRGRMEVVLDAAKSLGARDGENPARWRGHLSNLLPKSTRLKRIRHHPALPYDDIPAFVAELRVRSGVSVQCLEFTILTAARTTEAREAIWSEIDFEKKIWTVPGERMKAGLPHRVPLSDRAVEILKERAEARRNGYVFPGLKIGRPLSNMAMLELARRMRGRGKVTVHGFRSTLRDWASETQRASFDDATVEKAIAHVIENKSEAAYRRGDLLEARRVLMAAWEGYCGSKITKESANASEAIAA